MVYTWNMYWKNNSFFLLSVLICCIPIFLTFNRGINYFDEGYILEGARRILSGEVPYRDFHFVYTPVTIYYLSFFFRIFGQSLIVERIAASFLSMVGITFLGLSVRKMTNNTFLAFLSMALYAVWGPSHINFVWPVMCVLPLVFIYFYLLFSSHLLLSGVVMGILLLTKQNFGGALLISFMCYLVFTRYSKKQLLRISLGFLSVIAIFILHLLITQSFIPFLLDINTYTIQEILVRKSFSSPFPTQSIGKSILYVFPAILSLIICIGLLVKKVSRSLLIIPFTTLALYLFGIFPTPDWTHLTPLLSIMGLLFVLLPRIFGERYKILSLILLLGMMGAGIYSLYTRNYYRWEAPLIRQTNCFSSGPMKNICVDDKNYAVIVRTVPVIEREAKNNSYIFAFYNNPIYYFLANKNNPSLYLDFNVLISSKEQENVISHIKQKKVAIIITRFPPQNNQSRIVVEFIEKYYVPMQSTYEFTVWKLKTKS